MSKANITLEQYKKRMEEDDGWAPGWEAIEEAFQKMYPNQNPAHYGTHLEKRAMFGGNQYLDGYSVYESAKGYKHLLTYGMSNLYTDEAAYGEEWSGWGYEMTIKLKEETVENCFWAMDMLSNLAYYTNTHQRFFEPFQYISGNGSSIHKEMPSDITALVIVEDSEIQAKDTVHGKVMFLQLVGITEKELIKIKQEPSCVEALVEKMREDNPDLVTDMQRTHSYL